MAMAAAGSGGQGEDKKTKPVLVPYSHPEVPGDIETNPDKTIVFRAPWDKHNIYDLRLTNTAGKRIGWEMKPNSAGLAARITIDPAKSSLCPGNSAEIRVHVYPFKPYKTSVGEDDALRVLWKYTKTEAFEINEDKDTAYRVKVIEIKYEGLGDK